MALLAVLLTLLALLILCAPFLMSVQGADRASARMVDRATTRVALDSALRHARARLGGGHPALDPTPGFDGLAETSVDNEFPEDFYDADDPRGVMWDLETRDMAGLIDLNSAPPHLLANLLDAVGRLQANIDKNEKESGQAQKASAAAS